MVHRDALRLLNQLRTTEGSWALTDQLLALVASRRSGGQEPMDGVRCLPIE